MGRGWIPGLAVQAATVAMHYKNTKSTVIPGHKRSLSRPQDHPGKCQMCGAVLDMLTYPHAERHGYSSPLEMYNAGMYKHINFGDYVKKAEEIK